MFTCKYCGKEFEKSHQIAAHTSMCKKNPNSRYNKVKKTYITVKQICPKCGKEFELNILERQYLKGEYRKYCSYSCSNSRKLSEETKQKISKGVNEHNKLLNKTNKTNKIKFFVCKNCGKQFCAKKYRKYCTTECRKIGMHNALSMAGKKSISNQMDIRRSKAEMLFCQLCEDYFDKVTHNDPIFNGWDADVLIWDYKIAVLWNGKWHYEKITKKHSVEQVQNRDKIKCKEIENAGWKVYIIKDIGKFNKQFVKEQFDLFIKSLDNIAG